MPVGQQYDYTLEGPTGGVKGFMLARQPNGPRAWRRTGVPDVTSRRMPQDTLYGNVPDTLDHPEVWDDWSAGFGDAYRQPGRPNAYHWARGFDLRFPRQGIHAQAPQLLPARYASVNIYVNAFIDVPLTLIGGTLGPAGTGIVLLLKNSGVGAVGVGELTPTQYQSTAGSAFDVAVITAIGGRSWGDRPAIFGSFTYLPMTSGSPFVQRTHAGVYAAGPNEQARWFVVSGGRMWWTQDGYRVRSVAADADPLVTANYAATLSIGTGIGPSRDAISIENQLYVGFPDGLFQGNLSGTFNNIASDLGDLADIDNCRDLAAFQGGVAFAQGPHVWWFKPSTGANSELREVGPSGLFSNRSAIRGKFTALKGFGKWLYAGLFTGSQSYFMVGRDGSPPLPYVWHPLHDFLGLTCKVSRIHVDGITTSSGGVRIPNRIWCATEASFGSTAGATAPVFWWPIPYGDGNPLSDLNFSPNYMGSARMDLPESDWSAPGTAKTWRVAETVADSLLSGAQYADLYYTLDQGTRTLIARAQSSPHTNTNFPAGSGAFVQGQKLALSLDSFTASLNTTPVYRSLLVRGTLMPRSIDVIEAHTRIANRMQDRHGGQMRPGATQITELRAFAAGSAPSFLTDLAGATAWVKVQQPIDEQETYQVGETNPEIVAIAKMSVMDFSGG